MLGAGAPRGRPCQPSAAALQPAAEVEQTRRHALVGGAAALAASLLVPGCGLRRECASAGTLPHSSFHQAGLLGARAGAGQRGAGQQPRRTK